MLQLRNLKTGKIRSLAHMQFTSWPDFGVPLSATEMVKFIQRMRYMQRTLVKAHWMAHWIFVYHRHLPRHLPTKTRGRRDGWRSRNGQEDKIATVWLDPNAGSILLLSYCHFGIRRWRRIDPSSKRNLPLWTQAHSDISVQPLYYGSRISYREHSLFRYCIDSYRFLN